MYRNVCFRDLIIEPNKVYLELKDYNLLKHSIIKLNKKFNSINIIINIQKIA